MRIHLPFLTRFKRPHGCRLSRSRGFTLIELVVTVVIALVLAVIALPDLSELSAKNAIRNEADALFTTLATARTEAIRANVVVTVCSVDFTISGMVTTPTCSKANSSSDWSKGWASFLDVGYNQSNNQASNVQNIRMPGSFPLTVVASGFSLPTVADPTTRSIQQTIVFAPSGRNLSGAGTVTFSAPIRGRTTSITVSVSPSGWVSLGPLH